MQATHDTTELGDPAEQKVTKLTRLDENDENTDAHTHVHTHTHEQK